MWWALRRPCWPEGRRPGGPEEGGGARGEKIARAGPERPIDTTLRAERARHGFLAANDRGEEETALDKDGSLRLSESVRFDLRVVRIGYIT